MLHRDLMLMDYIKYGLGNAVVFASAITQSISDEMLWRGRATFIVGLIVGGLTIIKLIKDIRKK